MSVIVSILADEKVYLFVSGGAVNDFETVNKALNYFECGYNKNHSRGYEASMSALINGITFKPAIHEWENEDLSPLIDMGIIEEDTFNCYSLSHVSGRMLGALCTGKNAREFHDAGISPRLIS